jgi:hypothetical protein
MKLAIAAIAVAGVLLVTTTTLSSMTRPAAATQGDPSPYAARTNSGPPMRSADPTNSGISVPTITVQNQECTSAGGTSPITGACIATSTNTVTESGGVVGGR